MKRIIYLLVACSVMASPSALAILVTINMTADNIIDGGGLCTTATCQVGTGWSTLNGGALANSSNWTQSDSVSVELGAGTHSFAWHVANVGTGGAGNPAGLLADINWSGGSNVSSSAWEIFNVRTGAIIASATEYGSNAAADPNIWGPVAGISSSANWIWDSVNFSPNTLPQLWIRTSITIASVPEPGTLALLCSGLLGLAFTRRKRAPQD